MTSPLDKLLEAVERLDRTTLAPGTLAFAALVGDVVREAAEVRKARGEAVLWTVIPDGNWSQRQGPYETEAKAQSVSECLVRVAKCVVMPLFSAPPATVPRADVERLVKAARELIEQGDMAHQWMYDKWNAVLRDLGMEPRR